MSGLFFHARIAGGSSLDCPYAVLPDGSIFLLHCPDDYVLAAEIARDELGSRQDATDE